MIKKCLILPGICFAQKYLAWFVQGTKLTLVGGSITSTLEVIVAHKLVAEA